MNACHLGWGLLESPPLKPKLSHIPSQDSPAVYRLPGGQAGFGWSPGLGVS